MKKERTKAQIEERLKILNAAIAQNAIMMLTAKMSCDTNNYARLEKRAQQWKQRFNDELLSFELDSTLLEMIDKGEIRLGKAANK